LRKKGMSYRVGNGREEEEEEEEEERNRMGVILRSDEVQDDQREAWY
jgi:hypothetical protein